MRFWIFLPLAAALLMPEAAMGQAKTPAPKKPAAKAPAKKPAPAPIGQKQPTKDRYIEIQQALADAGYFEGPVSGVWGRTSIEALKQFQESEGLEPTGKIDALSLIRLNLGPQYDDPATTSQTSGNQPG